MSGRGRKRPSGRGSNSKKFAEVRGPDGTLVKVPVARDAGTFIYLAGPDGAWPRAPHVAILVDLPWLAPGVTVELEEMRAGHGMGTVQAVSVVETRVRISVFDGKYGQVKRLVLVKPDQSNDEHGDLSSEGLRALTRERS